MKFDEVARTRVFLKVALELARWFSASVSQGLDPDQRRRADDLIARHPWGTRPGVSASPWIPDRDPDAQTRTIIDITRVEWYLWNSGASTWHAS